MKSGGGTDSRHRQARWLRRVRKLHRVTGILLFAFFFIMALTGLLLGWKKHSGGILLAKTYECSLANLEDCLPTDSLHTIACI